MSSRRLVIAVFVVAASARDKQAAADSATAEAAATSTPTPQRIPVATGNPCEHTGMWAACSLERRLKQSGFVVRKLDEKPARAGFNIEPIVYSLGSSRLEVFIYPDEKALAKDLRSLDTLAVAPPGSTAAWPSTPKTKLPTVTFDASSGTPWGWLANWASSMGETSPEPP